MAHNLECRNLIRTWPTGFKLGPVTFTVGQGETIAVFGKNGAGKSTFFQLLSGMIDRSDGEILMFGQKMSPDAIDLRRRVGYLPQESHLPEWTTPDEILTYSAKLLGLPTVHEKVEKSLQLWDAMSWRHRPLGRSSIGMQRRVGLAIAMIHDPDLLILDEPFNALDIINSKTLCRSIVDRATRGKTTLISIHTTLLAAELCPRAIIIDRGQVEEITNWTSSGILERTKIIEDKFFGTGQ